MKPRQFTVGDLMVTAVITVHPDETVRDAHADMDMGGFRHLPVVDPRGRLVGILSDRDVLRALRRPKATTIAEVMTRSPVTVRLDSPAHVAAELMMDKKISSLPVVDDDGHLVGLITQTDFLDVARRALLSLPLVPT
jgi:CBS domain-containing protein